MSPFQIALNLVRRMRTLGGDGVLVPILPKSGLVVAKVFTPNVVPLVPKGDGL